MAKTKTSKDQNKALELVKKSYLNSQKASVLDWTRFSRYYKLFRNQQTNKNYTGLANLFIPEPYRIIRKKTARLANAIRGIEAIPESPNDVENAKLNTHLLNFLRRKLNWFIIERTAIQESRITGLSWLKAIWQVENETDERPYEGFEVSFESADRILLDPDATILDVFNGDYKYLIHEYESGIEELKENPNYDKTALDILSQRGGGKIEQNILSYARELTQRTASIKKDKKFAIYEYWGKYQETEGKPEEDYLIVVADKTLVLRCEKNPYSEILDNPVPFVPIVANPVGKELYPVGDLEPAESLFNELNDTRNQRMDTVTLNIDPPKEILKGAGINDADLIARRGWTIKSNIPNGVRFIPPDMQGVRAAIEEETAIRGDIQQVTGAIDFAPGSDIQAGVSIDTARGTMIAKGEADVLTEDEVNILKISLRMLYRIVLAYAQEFLDRSFVLRIVENGQQSFQQVDKNAIAGNYDLDIEMKTLQDKTTDQQLKLMLFNQAKTIPGANIGKFFSDVLSAFYENVNIQEYYQPPQPQPPQPPSVSISLRGDLNPLESDEIFKTIPGVDPKAADPLMRADLRALMQGQDPNHHQNALNQMELAQKQQSMQQTSQSMQQDMMNNPQNNVQQ